MFKLKTQKAFTLIELMVAISIMTIIILGSTNIDYNRLSNKQKLEIFTNNVKSDFERIRNNSLAGKGIGVNLDVPEKWSIEYSTSNSGTIISKYYNGSTFIDFENTLFQNDIYISNIRCLELDGTENYIIPSTETGSLEITGSNIILNGDCTDSTSKILEIEFTDKIDTKKIQINSLNGLVEIK